MSDLIEEEDKKRPRCKPVGARYGHRGVRVGEATDPGPPKRLHRSLASASQSTNRFEILSSEDELEVPTTVPASSGTVRAVQEARESQAPRRVGRLDLVSQGMDPFPRLVPQASNFVCVLSCRGWSRCLPGVVWAWEGSRGVGAGFEG